jgi:hypothetical protein
LLSQSEKRGLLLVLGKNSAMDMNAA